MSSTSEPLSSCPQDDAPRGPKVIVRPSAGLLLVVPVLGCVAAWLLYEILSFYMPTLPERTVSPPVFVTMTVLIYLLGMVVHEAGHAAAAKARGGRFVQVTLGAFNVALRMDLPRRRTNVDQWWISFTGPAAQLIFGSLLLAIAVRSDSSVLLAAGGMVAAEALAGISLPISHDNDAARLYRTSWACLRGRADQPSDYNDHEIGALP